MMFAGFMLGLLGSLHCIGMCGPIAFILPIDRNHSVKKVYQTSLYHLGRIAAYSLIGLVFGIMGRSLKIFGVQQSLSIFIGLLLMISVFFPSLQRSSTKHIKPLQNWIRWVSKRLGSLLKAKNPDTLLTLGFLNGFLPCGLVYVALFSAIAMPSAVESAGFMALFGLGTVPLMTSAIYLSSWFTPTVKTKLLKAVPYFIFIMGLLLFLRGLGLGIPFVSPKASSKTEQVTAAQHCS
jgi:uncharacterized protein